MKKEEMTCKNCIYSKEIGETLHCIYQLPARWESVTAYADFPIVSPRISCGNGEWLGSVIMEGSEKPVPWVYGFGEWDSADD